jgi:hypothetical protein
MAMKNLNNYIVERIIIAERIRIDNVKQVKFPIDDTIYEILEFLKEQGFKEVPNSTRNTMSKMLNMERNKCFIAYNNTIWFADTSKKEVSEDNPIFLIEKSSNTSSFSVYIPKKVIVNDDNKKEFLKELNKCFGWE